jgi:hypothetical protein
MSGKEIENIFICGLLYKLQKYYSKLKNNDKSSSSDCLETLYQQLRFSGELVCYYEAPGGRFLALS